MLATSKKHNDYQRENSIGRMDRRIAILQPITVKGDSNEDKITGYELIASKPRQWARVVNEVGDTVIEENQVRHLQKTEFTIRYRNDLSIKNKIVHNGKMYSVLSAIELSENRKRFTRITGEYLKEYAI